MPEERQGIAADVVAGVSVALVLIPQSLAYADLAGLPPWHGLYAAAAAPLLAAPFVSSRYLQTGPVAVTSLLTAGALGTMAAAGSAEYVGLAALLALVVGVARVAVGLLKRGSIAWLMSPPVMRGFVIAAALLIFASQLPSALGVATDEQGLLRRAFVAFSAPGSWSVGALLLAVATIALVRGGRLIHPLFPGVLVAAVLALVCSWAGAPVAGLVGDVPAGLPSLRFDLPWSRLPVLLVPGLVIAFVGFAEPAAIARTFADADGEPWDPDREFVSQGAANIAAAFVSGFPVGGSFSRSSLARTAGARTALAGAVVGLVVLAVLPFAGVVGALPRAFLGGTIIAAIAPLLDPRPLLSMWKESRSSALVAWATFGLTLGSAPRVEIGVVAGVVLAAVVRVRTGGTWGVAAPPVPKKEEV